MTLLAGAFSRRGTLEHSDELLATMARHMSRNAADSLEIVRDPHALLVKIDIGALGERGQFEDAVAVTMVAGEPIVRTPESTYRTRETDTAALHDVLRDGQYSKLADTRGVFSIAHYHRADRRLVIATDKLGIRPLYVWTDGDLVVFSSTIRLLEACTQLTKTIDVDGLAERVAFGFSFGARTAYENISLLEPGEAIEFTAQAVTRTEYWRWQDILCSTSDLPTLSKAAHAAFMNAVRVRQRGDRATTAFLSGGLDSRVVVAALRSDGVDVHSFNFSLEGTEDREYGAQLARAAGTVHESLDLDDPVDMRWSMMIAKAHARSAAAIKARVERPQVMWSGDGGSVTLGQVYLRPRIMACAAAGDVSGVANEYIEAEHGFVPARLLTSSVAPRMAAAPLEGIMAELLRLKTNDLSQTFYLFLMHNDQHRHLFHHFEGIDEHRIELQLPFFDSDFVAIIASIPVEARLYHAFYVDWLNEFPDYVSGTYWQAYPGHVPSPIPPTKTLGYQWDPTVFATRSALVQRRTIQRALGTVASRSFAGALMKRRVLATAAALHAAGLRNFDYLFEAADTIQRHWDVTKSPSDVAVKAMEPADSRKEREVGEKGAVQEPGQDRNLDRSLMSGILWTSAVKWGGQPATWISTLVVARVLGPDAYGLVGMAIIYMGLVTMLSEFGIGSAVVTLRTMTRSQIAQVNTIAVGFGLMSMLVSFVAAHLVGLAFGVPQVTSIILALSATLLLSGLQTVPTALLQREMRFKLLAMAEGTQTILVAIVTVILALRGAGFWALVLGQIVGAVVLTAVLVTARPSPFAIPRRSELGAALTFSSHMIIARLAWYAYSNADFAVVGRVLGKSALGAYSFGWTMANVPIEKVTSMVVRVTPSILAAAQHDHAALRRYLLRITEAIAVITFPATVGLALVAEPFVLAALGDAWRAAILPLQLLAIYSGIRSISPLLPQLLTALGNTKLPMQVNVAGAIGFPIAFIVASRWGAAGVAAAWIVVHPFSLAPMYITAFRAINLPASDYLGALWPAISGVVVMTTAVLAAQHWIVHWTALAQLLELSVVGAIAYSLTLLLAHRGRVRALNAMLGELRAGR